MKKLLYVTIPFVEIPGQHPSRPGFIWSVLNRHFAADLCLVKTPEYLTRPVPPLETGGQIFSLAAEAAQPFRPKQVLHFSRENLDKFSHLIANQAYDLIFVQSEALLELSLQAAHAAPESRLVLDWDNLMSVAEKKLWEQDPSWKNKTRQLDHLSLRRWEKQMLSLPCNCIFTNRSDRQAALQLGGYAESETDHIILPNPLTLANPDNRHVSFPEESVLKDKEQFLLFCGDLSTPAHLDAFQYLARDIYPRIAQQLQKTDVKIYVAGSNPVPLHAQLTGGRVRLVATDTYPSALLKKCLFVLLPLRQPDEAAAELILAAAAQGKTVLTTGKALDKIDFGPEEIPRATNITAYCDNLIHLLANPDEPREMGRRLAVQAAADFDPSRLEQRLFDFVEKTVTQPLPDRSSSGLDLVLVSNACGLDSGEPGAHVYSVALQLAQTNKVTVFTPRLPHQPRLESSGNLTIRRLFSLPLSFNPKSGININRFSPGLLPQLLKIRCDQIHCYSGWSLDNLAAFTAAKLREIPLSLTWLTAKIPDQKKKSHKGNKFIKPAEDLLNWRERLLLRYSDYLFTPAEKGYLQLRQYNDRVEQIPLPLDLKDYEQELPSPRWAYDVADEEFVILVPGQIARHQGQDLAVLAFNRALPQLSQARLIITGNPDTDPDFQDELEALISREALQQDIIFTGAIEPEETRAWLQSADLVLVPSRRMDTGAFVLAGWAAGTPVLQSDAVDPNLVQEGVNGYLFRNGDVDDLALQLQKACLHKDQLNGLAEQGKSLIKDKFNFGYLAERYLDAYKQLTLS